MSCRSLGLDVDSLFEAGIGFGDTLGGIRIFAVTCAYVSFLVSFSNVSSLASIESIFSTFSQSHRVFLSEH